MFKIYAYRNRYFGEVSLAWKENTTKETKYIKTD